MTQRPHLLVTRPEQAHAFRGRSAARGGQALPPREPEQHALSLTRQLAGAIRHITESRPEPAIEGARPAFYLEFVTRTGELALDSLDQRSQGVEVLSVTRDGDTQRARVVLPEQARALFARKFDEYERERTPKGRPKNERLVAPIDEIRAMTLRDLWTDDAALLPEHPNQSIWWEVWLRRAHADELRLVGLFAKQHELRFSHDAEQRVPVLVFPDRSVVLVYGPRRAMERLIDTLDVVAELRRARELTSTFAEMDNVEQRAWVDDIIGRIQPPPANAPAACILDGGVNHGHPLLSPALDDSDLHTCHPESGPADFDGHGTTMAGLALYGDLIQAALAPGEVPLTHRLESVKIVPNRGANEPHLYGWVTQDAAYKVELQAPDRRRVFALPITVAERDDGRPTSWSAAIDLLAAGCAFQTDLLGEHSVDPEFTAPPRLYVISAGNVEASLRLDYPERNLVTSIQSPAQAWNALTVGASTALIHIDPDDASLRGWTPLAERGQLSPYSTTSVAWDGDWPLKPDIVMEGGNVAVSPGRTETSDGVDDLSLLTTSARLQQRLFTTTWATSAACAQAAALAARLSARYPELRPETLRGLMVHAARWTPAMQAAIDGGNKTQRARLVRQFGFGVPDERRALASVDGALTLVVEREINACIVDGRDVRLGEIHLHALPWPRAVLEALHEADAILRVTLSYFIEPNPGERGWRGRYRYASHGLRFDLKTPDETDAQFHVRLNRLAEEDRAVETRSDSDRWVIGPGNRHRGSLHHDIWTGSARELAAKGTLAVYPVGGWWSETQRGRARIRPVHYSLIVSIETPGSEADLYAAAEGLAGVQRLAVAVAV